MVGDDERVLSVARRMVRWEVEGLEIVVVGLDLGAFSDGVAHCLEDADDFIQRSDQGMFDAEFPSRAGEGDVDALLLEP